MRIEPEDPQVSLERMSSRLAIGTLLVLALAIVPAARLQLGRVGWEILQEDAAGAFWPLAAVGAAGVAFLLAYVLWLRARALLLPLVTLAPLGLALVGAVIGISALEQVGEVVQRTPTAERFAVSMGEMARTLAAPSWALFLCAATSAAASVVLATQELGRSSTFTIPLVPLIVAVGCLAGINVVHLYLQRGPRPLTSIIFTIALFGPLVLAAAREEEGPVFGDRRDATALGCLMLAVGAALALAGAESLLRRAAALYAQGVGSGAHAKSMALGGVMGNTARALGQTAIVGGVLATIAAVLWGPVRLGLRPVGRRALAVAFVVALLMGLGIGGALLHRRAVSHAITRYSQTPSARTRGPNRYNDAAAAAPVPQPVRPPRRSDL